MNRFLNLVGFALLAASCGGNEGAVAPLPTSPSALPAPVVAPAPRTSVESIRGFVLDTGFRAVPGARVEVVDGSPHAGTSTTSSASGEFTLVGTFTEATTFRAAKDGYVTATQRWSCSVATCPGVFNANPWLGFYLAVPAAPANIAGEYTITFIADSACSDLPEDVRVRTFAATITPKPGASGFNVTATVPPFVNRFNAFEIGVAGDYLGIWLHGGHDPALVEQIAPNRYVALSGVASASVGAGAASTITAPFDGWIEFCESNSPIPYPYDCRPASATQKVMCESKNHRLTLTRR